MASAYIGNRQVHDWDNLADDFNDRTRSRIAQNVKLFCERYAQNISITRSNASDGDQNYEIYDITAGTLTEENKTDFRSSFPQIVIEPKRLKFPRVLSNEPQKTLTNTSTDKQVLVKNCIYLCVICIVLYLVNSY